ncbi:MAG: Fic/DOC family N-terminal domain-containing protein [Phycisphaerales bacterium]
MDISKFTKSMTGKLVTIDHPRYKHAFIPNPIPDWTVPDALIDLCIEVGAALGEMNGSLNDLPNPDLLMRPLREREALQSSRLEGTDADPAELVLFAKDPRDSKSASDPANSFVEVLNYGDAMLHGYKRMSHQGLTLSLIKEMHQCLLNGVRGEDKKPGQFRNDLVGIGRPARFIPPPAVFVPDLLDDFQKYITRPYTSARDRMVRAFVAHYQFETIHPFFDGNGRIGRVVMSLMIHAACGHSLPWLYMSPYFERNADEYAQKLFRVSANGEWSEWVEFCLNGAIEQAKDAVDRSKLLWAIRERYVKRSSGIASPRTTRIIDGFFDSPVIRVPDIQRGFGVHYNTAKNDIDDLVKIGILRQLRDTRPITYYAWEFFRVTFQDKPRMATEEEINEEVAKNASAP